MINTFQEITLYISIFFGLFTGIFFLLTFFENRKNLKDPIPKTFPKVSIIVPAYNEEKTIEKTVKSLLNSNYPKNKLEIIIVDDGSTDKTLKVAKRLEGKRVKVFTKKNGGKATALNFALKRCNGELVGALDADSFIQENAIMNIIGYFDSKNVMAVTPTLKIWNPKTGLQKIQMIEYLFGVFLRKVFSFIGSIHVTPGPLTIYRKKFFDKYGGYDEGNITEDIEVALRIQSKGFVIENSMNANVYTVGPSKIKGLIRQRRRWYRGFLDNIVKYPNLFSPKHGNLGMFILPAALLSVILVLFLIFQIMWNIGVKIIQNLSTDPEIILFRVTYFFSNFIEIAGLYLTNPIILLSLILISIGIANVLLAKIYSKDKQNIKVSFIAYMFIYGFLFAIWWSSAIITKIFNIKVKW